MARTAKVRAEDRRQLVDVAYRKAVRRSDVVERTICLEALAPALESDQLDSVINAALAIEDDSLRARVLVAVAPHLSSELKERVVRSLNAFAEAWPLASVIEALGPAVNTKAADLFEQAAIPETEIPLLEYLATFNVQNPISILRNRSSNSWRRLRF
jgi:hypothetical protein